MYVRKFILKKSGLLLCTDTFECQFCSSLCLKFGVNFAFVLNPKSAVKLNRRIFSTVSISLALPLGFKHTQAIK